MQTVVETPTFYRRADKLLSEEEHAELINWLARYPTAGAEMVGTGGIRKMRFGALGKGKSGDRDLPIYALLIYAKNERADLTPDERKAVAAFAAAIKGARRQG